MRLRVFPLLIALFDGLGVNAVYRWRNRRKALILWYHGVGADDFAGQAGFGDRHLPVSSLERQIGYLKRKGYRFTTMTELLRRKREGLPLDRLVCLTFDDGFRNVVEKGYPVMRRLGAKGCLYLVSGLIGTDELLWTDRIDLILRACRENEFRWRFRGTERVHPLGSPERLDRAVAEIKAALKAIPDRERRAHMAAFAGAGAAAAPAELFFADWDEIRSLDREVLELGSHTTNHPSCANLVDEEEFGVELGESKRRIEEEVGYAVEHFNYPSGSFNEETVAQARRYGYQSAVTIVNGYVEPGDDDFRLRRVATSANFTTFKAQVCGSHALAGRITSLGRRRR
jgi:peptidoglycan/xylan/chitin deacetylase (PgdA/CDA1 family)